MFFRPFTLDLPCSLLLCFKDYWLWHAITAGVDVVPRMAVMQLFVFPARVAGKDLGHRHRTQVASAFRFNHAVLRECKPQSKT